MARHGLARAERVRKSRDYQEIRDRGRRVSAPHFFISYFERESGGLRLGLTVSRKVGKAHDRNRVKRWVREFFRINKDMIRGKIGKQDEDEATWGVDLIFTARPGAAEIEHGEADAELRSLLGKLPDNCR